MQSASSLYFFQNSFLHYIQFYLDNLEDELNITALRMLVKDLLILFQAGNEGVINVLGTLPTSPGPCQPHNDYIEHYFEMSHVDAEQALALYRHFCKQTECVVEFLGVAKKLQNLLNVPIPNLKHVSILASRPLASIYVSITGARIVSRCPAGVS